MVALLLGRWGLSRLDLKRTHGGTCKFLRERHCILRCHNTERWYMNNVMLLYLTFQAVARMRISYINDYPHQWSSPYLTLLIANSATRTESVVVRFQPSTSAACSLVNTDYMWTISQSVQHWNQLEWNQCHQIALPKIQFNKVGPHPLYFVYSNANFALRKLHKVPITGHQRYLYFY